MPEIERGLTTVYDALARKLVEVDVQLAREIRRQGVKALRAKPTPAAVKLYLLALAIDQALPQPAKPKPRARRSSAGS